jgi:S1-C subfamily serine protease
VAGALSVLLVVWFLLPAAASTPGPIARQVRTSTVVDWIEALAPEPPDAARALARMVDRSGFPQVFADLGPAPDVGPPPSEIPVPQDVIQAVTASTVNVEAFGCGNGFEGSGFVVRPGLVVTNAHVVAGATDIQLRRPDGQVVPARIRTSDDNRDLALLEADVGRDPLPLAQPVVGQSGASIGYPGGQNTPVTSPVTIRDDRTTVGRDIYGQDVVERRVLYLSAELKQGDSGSPLIDPDGAVVGVVFAVSPDSATTAYALHVDELQAVLGESPNRTTGRCL